MASLDEAFNLIKPNIIETPSQTNYPYKHHKLNSHCPKCGKFSSKTMTTNDGNMTQIYDCGHTVHYD